MKTEEQEAQTMAQVFAWAVLILIILVELSTSIQLALQNVLWDKLDGQAKFLIGILIFAKWGNTMIAFLSRKASQLRKGKPITNGDDDTTPPIKPDGKP